MSARLNDRRIMGIDVNAYSPRWHDHRRNEKGRLVEAMNDNLKLRIHNMSNHAWTFHGQHGKSNVDVTLSSESMYTKIADWTVEGATTFDHVLISFIINDDVTELSCHKRIRYKENTINKHSFQAAVRDALAESIPPADVNGKARHLTQSLKKAFEKALPRQERRTILRPPWWNSETTDSRRILKRAHRFMLRTGLPEDRERFKTARNTHVWNIRKTKKQIWIKCAEDSNPPKNTWGKLTK